MFWMLILKNLQYWSSWISKKMHSISKILRYLVVHIYQIWAIFHFWVPQYQILLYSISEYILQYRRSISYPISKHNIWASIPKIHDAYISIYLYLVLYSILKIGKVPGVNILKLVHQSYSWLSIIIIIFFIKFSTYYISFLKIVFCPLFFLFLYLCQRTDNCIHSLFLLTIILVVLIIFGTCHVIIMTMMTIIFIIYMYKELYKQSNE